MITENRLPMTNAIKQDYRVSDFDYTLPTDLIAHEPLENRGNSRLFVLHKDGHHHHAFSDLRQWLQPDDILVINNTKVINARLRAARKTGAKIEIFLLKHLENSDWLALIKPGKRVKNRETLSINKDLSITIKEKHVAGEQHLVTLNASDDMWQAIDKYGELPLPPYLQPQKSVGDYAKHYQTTFAEESGAVAAPTAGLHFSEAHLMALKEMGVQCCPITLHVGYGTFKPVTAEDPDAHVMHSENYHISASTAATINKALKENRRIIAVGTTVVRTLESAHRPGQGVEAGAGDTDIFIRPGYTFKVISGLITNFHLPKSTLLMLVSAFVGKDKIDQAYKDAIQQGYRFFSFGDAMLLLP